MPENRIERLCIEKGMKMTEQRRIIARVLSAANDHPDVEEVYRRAKLKITDIEARIEQLQRIKGALDHMARACNGAGPKGECPILEALAHEERRIASS